VTDLGLASFVRDVRQQREVLRNFVQRDLKLKYKRTVFGYVWSLLNPLLQLAVLTAVFSNILRVGSRDYLLFLFPGMLGWTFFQNTVVIGATTFIENQGFLRKIDVAKVLFPLSNLCVRTVELGLSLVALTGVGLALGFSLRSSYALVPLAAAILVTFAFGVSLLAAVATVYFRDMQYLLAVAFQLGYFLTPVLYPLATLPPAFRTFVGANPVYLELRLLQELVTDGRIPPASEWLLAVGIAAVAVIAGLWALRSRDEELLLWL
jgi:ABC-type polysaccharide/polyol phosphate export permease